MKNVFIMAMLWSVLTGISFAQSEDRDLKKFPVQASFFYPIGSHGLHSNSYEYQFSLNMLVGKTGGIDGFELGGLVNLNEKYMHGFQVAGIGNMSNGPSTGFQTAGIFNIVGGNFDGFQGAGIINITNGKSQTAQFGGIANIALGIDGIQCGGIANVSTDSIDGAQIAGIVNLATSVKGAQISGIANTSANVEGFQLAGIVNIADNVKGAQVAGILNICDSIDGVPLALISYVRKNGYRKLELSTSEFEWGRVTYKTGVRKLYTLFSLGYQGDSPEYNITFGSGIGTSLLMKNKKSAIDIEWRINQVTKNFTIKENLLLNTWSIDYSATLFKRFELFAGPSANMLIASNSLTAAKIAPKWAKAYRYDNRLWGWFGFHAGLRF